MKHWEIGVIDALAAIIRATPNEGHLWLDDVMSELGVTLEGYKSAPGHDEFNVDVIEQTLAEIE